MLINSKELRISFAKKPTDSDQVIVGGKELEAVDSAKLLGVTICSSLSWNAHIEGVIKKASKRLYFLVQLKRARVPPNHMMLFFTACIKSIIDYAIPAVYHALPQCLNGPYRLSNSTRRQIQHWVRIFGDFNSGGTPWSAWQHLF